VTICNNDYKLTAYSHNILHEFAVDDEVMITIHFERLPPGTMRKLHVRCTGSYKVLRRIASIIHELDIPWDPCINPIFSEEDSTLSDACDFLHLPSIVAGPSHIANSTSTTLVQM